MANAGHTKAEIQRATGFGKSTVKRWFDRRGEENVQDRPRSGRPNKQNPINRRTLRKILRSAGTTSIRRARKYINANYACSLSYGTVFNLIHQHNLVYKRRKRKPKLDPAQIAKRLAYASRRRRNGWWNQILFTDEHYISVATKQRGQWCRDTEQAEYIRSSKYTEGSIMIWAGISMYGRTQLYRVYKKDTNKDYQALLNAGPFQEARDMYKGSKLPWFFQQDGAGFHRAKGMSEFFDAHDVLLHPNHPPNSPDLNPIENVWGMLNARVNEYNLKSKDHAFKVAQREWALIPQEAINRQIASMPKRLRACKLAGGEITKY